MTADDTNALTAPQADGFATPNGGPIGLAARSINSTGEPCREYVQTVMINNAAIHATAVVCRRPWGAWHVITRPKSANIRPRSTRTSSNRAITSTHF